jgi:hypothetical protein
LQLHPHKLSLLSNLFPPTLSPLTPTTACTQAKKMRPSPSPPLPSCLSSSLNPYRGNECLKKP